MVRITADTGIPGVLEALSPFGEVRLMEPAAMRPANLADTDILIVRSVANVGKEMLSGTPIRMVGSATAGTDHVDKTYLKARKIAFAHAPGANADSVADHVITAMLMLAARTGERLAGKVLGVVGYGQVGTRVTRRALGLGVSIMICDPPLDEAGGDAGTTGFQSLDHVLVESDFLSLHTPLVSTGRHPTLHLLDAGRIAGFRGCLLNTSRGGVIDNAALRHCLEAGRGPAATVLDVWEGEPSPDPRLVSRVDIATPHVAGYATDSKWEATRQMAVAVSRFLEGPDVSLAGMGPTGLPDVSLSAPPFSGHLGVDAEMSWLADLAHAMCPLRRDDAGLRNALATSDSGAAFEAFRARYPGRRLMRCHRVRGVPDRLTGLVESVLECRCA